MTKSQRAYERFIGIAMYAAFIGAFVWGVMVVVVSYRDTDGISFGDALSAVGVYLALGVFYSADRMRRSTDRSMNARFDEVLNEVKKRECKCQSDCRGEADAEEAMGRSWLAGLIGHCVLR